MRTYCLGYWPLPNNRKRAIGKYKEMLPKTFRLMRDQKCVFFSNSEDWLELAKALGKEQSVDVHQKYIEIKELPGNRFVDTYLSRTREYGETIDIPSVSGLEKGKAHYVRDYVGSGPDVYKKMLAIWMSKTSLLAEVSEKNPGESWWIDASISRIYKKNSRPNISEVSPPAGRIAHLSGNSMKKHGRNLPVLGGVFGGDDFAIKKLNMLFWRYCELMKDEVYPNDEECVLAKIYMDYPELLHKINARNTPVIGPF